MYKVESAHIEKDVECYDVEDIKSMFNTVGFYIAEYHGYMDGVYYFTVYSRYNNSRPSLKVETGLYSGFVDFDDFRKFGKGFPERVNNIFEV